MRPVLLPALMESDRFRETQTLFARALAVVPGGIYGHQTPAMLVPGAYPYFFARGEGARIWDVDGNEYLDLMCSYGPIVLGHNHPKVEEAARHQAAEGNCFNGPGRVWVELAEHLVALTPWAARGRRRRDHGEPLPSRRLPRPGDARPGVPCRAPRAVRPAGRGPHPGRRARRFPPRPARFRRGRRGASRSLLLLQGARQRASD